MKIKGPTIETQRLTIEFVDLAGCSEPFLQIYNTNGDDSVDTLLLTGAEARWLCTQLRNYPKLNDPRVLKDDRAPEGAPLVEIKEPK
jgi:hypothetical protein